MNKHNRVTGFQIQDPVGSTRIEENMFQVKLVARGNQKKMNVKLGLVSKDTF